ncbi:MAG: GNAT family N-acetyltransferase [Pseudomonadota bacterium]
MHENDNIDPGATPDILIRRIESADIPAVHDLIESAYRGESARSSWVHEGPMAEGKRIERSALIALCNGATDVMLVATRHGDVIGCVCVSDRGSGIAELGLLAVSPNQQTDGLGKRLVEAAETEGQYRFQAVAMQLSVVAQRPKLLHYYERRGYVLTGEISPYPVPLEPPLHFAVMRKTLGTSSHRHPL